MLIYIPNKNLNQLMRDSMKRLQARAAGAKSVDIIVRVDGKETRFEGDWLKHMQLPRHESETKGVIPLRTKTGSPLIDSATRQECSALACGCFTTIFHGIPIRTACVTHMMQPLICPHGQSYSQACNLCDGA